MTDDFSNELPVTPILNRFTILASMLFVAAAGLLFAWLIAGMRPLGPPPPQFVGRPFPEIVVEGWLNGPGPTAEELAGKVYLVEAWAWWCGPCLELSPHLVELHERFRDQGVVFIGLTSEDGTSLPKSRRFLERARIDWPNGYGASPTLEHFYPDSMAIPTMWVVGKDGKVAWDGHPQALPPDLLEELLAK